MNDDQRRADTAPYLNSAVGRFAKLLPQTNFMALYPNGVHREPYRGFRDDAVLTLGRCMMDGQCWNGPDIAVGTVLHPSNNNPNRVWGWWDASGDFAASMFFCLKYLPASLVETWLRSVLEITSPHWRAQVVVWMVGAHLEAELAEIPTTFEKLYVRRKQPGVILCV